MGSTVYQFGDSIKIKKNTLNADHWSYWPTENKKVSKEFTVSWKYDTSVISTKAGAKSRCYATEIRSQEGNEINLQEGGSRRGDQTGEILELVLNKG